LNQVSAIDGQTAVGHMIFVDLVSKVLPGNAESAAKGMRLFCQ